MEVDPSFGSWELVVVGVASICWGGGLLCLLLWVSGLHLILFQLSVLWGDCRGPGAKARRGSRGPCQLLEEAPFMASSGEGVSARM